MTLKLFALVSTLVFSQCVFAVRVILIIPDKEGAAFWDMVYQASFASAKSLGMSLEVIYGGDNRFTTLAIIEDIVTQPSQPDYLIFRPYHGNTANVFDTIEAKGIDFVTLEQAFADNETTELLKPKQKYKHWIGEVAYDNVSGGALLLKALIDAHLSQHPDIKPSITGIGGNFDYLSRTREQSLNALYRRNDIDLNQIFPTYWDPQNIATNFETILKRYPHTNIFWCASGQLTLKTLQQYQLLSNKPTVIGGFDWLPEALLKIQQGELTASVGGHFLMGAIAMTKIFDYQHGVDRFSNHNALYDFEVINKNNVTEYLDVVQHQKWQKVDFGKFSEFKAGKNLQTLNMQNIINSLN
ncbi:ABC transporter substrate-binding protein [Paraglaciecola arctica]|uniref:ABC transporter substrate-binding protein n=1 Tax=Paraglaciecola arctica TaxID=1128911 RepID=UPI001C077ECC|nr:ABC transporter substrate-binding protein [Paraglaciecola arctica]MBU3003669.1 ABC transporter substrate-binding protein [Paraglaciecola arctica]